VSTIEIVGFRREHREQLTDLVNAHIAAVVPGWAVSTATVLSHLERDPGEYVVGPWVRERKTLVATERDRVVAAALLRRYGDDERMTTEFRNAGEIAWLVCWPEHLAAGVALADACVEQLDRWNVAAQWCDCSLPTPTTYGLPDAWGHLRHILERVGFSAADGHDEFHWAGALDAVPPPGPPPIEGLTIRRSVGNMATRFAAHLDECQPIAYFHLATDMTNGGALSAFAGWADVWELHVEEPYRRRGIGTWIVRHGVAWARLGRCDRILLTLSEEDLAAGVPEFLQSFSWQQINRTRRGWTRQPRRITT
jgi:GNAT superfamily N-acetyltransferase